MKTITHVCDEHCRCPRCGGPMYYAPTYGSHACVDPTCAAPSKPPGSARFYAMLPVPPAVGGRDEAVEFHNAVLEAIAAPVTPPWTHQERTHLQRIEKRWRERATGRDLRWLLVGSKSGRLPRETEQTLEAPADPEWGQEDK